MKKFSIGVLLGISIVTCILLAIGFSGRYHQSKKQTSRKTNIATSIIDTHPHTLPSKITYLWKDETIDILSGTTTLTREEVLLLHLPLGRRSVIYLSGQDYTESRAMLSKVPSECPTSQCRKEENGIVVAGSRRGPTLLHLPTDKTLTGTTLMIRVLANQGGEVFRELSNKETYRKNENGAVYEYLSGTANSAYEGAYKGFDLFGEIVPLPAPTT